MGYQNFSQKVPSTTAASTAIELFRAPNEGVKLWYLHYSTDTAMELYFYINRDDLAARIFPTFQPANGTFGQVVYGMISMGKGQILYGKGSATGNVDWFGVYETPDGSQIGAPPLSALNPTPEKSQVR